MAKDLIVRSSSAEFLIFERQKGEKGIEVRFEDGDLWLTQKALGELYNTSKQDISYHLGNIFRDLELVEHLGTGIRKILKKYDKELLITDNHYDNLSAYTNDNGNIKLLSEH